MFTYSHWRALSLPTRALIAQIFGIAKTGSTHVVDNRVESDGYKIEDVENALTVKKLQLYFDTTEKDIENLFTMLVDKVEGRIVVEDSLPPSKDGEVGADPMLPVSPAPLMVGGESLSESVNGIKKRGRPAK